MTRRTARQHGRITCPASIPRCLAPWKVMALAMTNMEINASGGAPIEMLVYDQNTSEAQPRQSNESQVVDDLAVIQKTNTEIKAIGEAQSEMLVHDQNTPKAQHAVPVHEPNINAKLVETPYEMSSNQKLSPRSWLDPKHECGCLPEVFYA